MYCAYILTIEPTEYMYVLFFKLSMFLSLSLYLSLSGVAPPKTGLQWQQPFLELVLACMHAQTNTHEELLHPLKSQLSTFLNAFDRVSDVTVCDLR